MLLLSLVVVFLVLGYFIKRRSKKTGRGGLIDPIALHKALKQQKEQPKSLWPWSKRKRPAQ